MDRAGAAEDYAGVLGERVGEEVGGEVVGREDGQVSELLLGRREEWAEVQLVRI